MRLLRQRLARRTTRNDRLSLDRSSIPFRQGRRPALAGQRGFLKLQIPYDKPQLITLSLPLCQDNTGHFSTLIECSKSRV
jgi:hypothetical protein